MSSLAREASSSQDNVAAFPVAAQNTAIVPPRRPRRARQSVSWDPTLDIYDDTFSFKVASTDDQQQRVVPAEFTDVTLPRIRHSVLLTQPAQRFALPGPSQHSTSSESAKKRRLSLYLGKPTDTSRHRIDPKWPSHLAQPPAPGLVTGHSHRDNAVYIAPQTAKTIYSVPVSDPAPALARRPRRSSILPDFEAAKPASPVKQQIVPQQARRAARLSFGGAPRRGPLQQCLQPMQVKAIVHDVAGSGTGKENLPPGARRAPWDYCGNQLKVLEPINESSELFSEMCTKTLAPLPQSFPEQSTGLFRQPQSSTTNIAPINTPTIEQVNKFLSPITTTTSLQKSRPKPRQSLLPIQSRRSSDLPQPPARTKLHAFSAIPEDLSTPALYEDRWLEHQEAVAKDCINMVLDVSALKTSKAHCPAEDVRRILIEMHNQPSVDLLQKRLEAALAFGALSISNNALCEVSRISDDVHQRRRFLDLWLKTYDLDYLVTALEIVLGRQVFDDPSATLPQECGIKRDQRLKQYLRSFLIHNEDFHAKRNPKANSNGNSELKSWSWRRTVSRSLLLIRLLDQAKTTFVLHGCIFQVGSTLKSSKAVLQALGSLLAPSVGNVVRVLEHLNFSVEHVQNLRDEVEYRIDNVAVDLRDGTLLCHLCDVLCNDHTGTENSTVDIANSVRPLTGRTGLLVERLKYPCQSRALKLHNVELALGRLSSSDATRVIAANVTAEEIVDGHKEKTIALLLGLTGRFGMSMIVDIGLLTEETARLERISLPNDRLEDRVNDSSSADCDDRLPRHKVLPAMLYRWSSRAALLEGVVIQNLSTSFADGKAYAAILRNYEQCTSMDNTMASNTGGSRHKTTSPQTLLHGLGCSKAVSQLFSQQLSSIPTQHTTLPLLALLASRLLPRARLYHAAVVIQRAWKKARSMQVGVAVSQEHEAIRNLLD